ATGPQTTGSQPWRCRGRAASARHDDRSHEGADGLQSRRTAAKSVFLSARHMTRSNDPSTPAEGEPHLERLFSSAVPPNLRPARLKGHRAAAGALLYTRSGTLVSGGEDGTLRRCPTDGGTPLSVAIHGCTAFKTDPELS